LVGKHLRTAMAVPPMLHIAQASQFTFATAVAIVKIWQ